MNKQTVIDQLKERMNGFAWPREKSICAYSTGIDSIDRALKHGGIVSGACHEIISFHEGPALGFALHLVSPITKRAPILWCSHQENIYMPGFLSYGIKDDDIIFVKTQNETQSLWAIEQGLQSNSFSAVILEISNISLSQGRRLKLVAQKHGTTAIFILKPKKVLPTIATTRWAIAPLPSEGLNPRNGIKAVGAKKLLIQLLKNQGGASPLSWKVEFNEQTLRFHTLPAFLPSTDKKYKTA